MAYIVGPPPRALNRRSKTWTALPLRPYFWIPLVVILVGAAAGLEIALYFSNKHQGEGLRCWPLPFLLEWPLKLTRLGIWRQSEEVDFNRFALRLRMPPDVLTVIASTYFIRIRHFLQLSWPPLFVPAINMIYIY